MLSLRRIWQQTTMHCLKGSPDPDMQPCDVILPTNFGFDEACALTELFGNGERILFSEKVNNWLERLGTNQEQAFYFLRLLEDKKLAPTPSVWTGAPGEKGFIINLGAFVAGDGHFSLYEFDHVLSFLSTITSQQDKDSLLLRDTDPAIYLTNLDLFLAKLGHLYASDEGQLSALYVTLIAKRRTSGHALAHHTALKDRTFPKTRARLKDAIKELAFLYVPSKTPPDFTLNVGYTTPNPIDRLLCVETCGCAPSFSLTREDGTLTQSLIFRLSHRGYTPHSALTALLNGGLSLSPNDRYDYLRMYDLLARENVIMPPRPKSSSNLPLDRTSSKDFHKKSRHFLRLVS